MVRLDRQIVTPFNYIRSYKMKASQLLISTAAVASVLGAFGLSYAQSTRNNINVQGPGNLTQTQSDAAMPCQPTPYNPHLPQGTKQSSGNVVNGTTTDCANVVIAPVAISPEPLYVQTQVAQPAPIVPMAQPTYVAPEPQFVPRADSVNTSMADEPMARADRN